MNIYYIHLTSTNMLLSAYHRVQLAKSSGSFPEDMKDLKDSLMNEVIYQLTPLDDKIGKDSKDGCLGLTTKYVTLYGRFHTISLERTLKWLAKPIKIDSKQREKLQWFAELEEKEPLKFGKLGSKQINHYELLKLEKKRDSERSELIKIVYEKLKKEAEYDDGIICMEKNDLLEIYFNADGFRRFCSQQRWSGCNTIRDAFVY